MNVTGQRQRFPARAAAITIAAVVGFAGLGMGAAAAAVAAPVTPRTLAVSTPPDATAIAPGRTGTIPVRIVNGSRAAIVVTMSPRGVVLADDGKVRLATGPDPLWSGRVDFPRGRLAIPARSYIAAPIRVRMPDRISADLYFVGFVVTPEARSTQGLAVVNQIGSFFTIDVPGPRLRNLAAELVAPNFVFGSVARGTVRVRNVGHASAQFWGENDTTSSPGSHVPTQERIEKALLPLHTARSYTVSARPAWPIGIVTMKIHLAYPYRDGSATRELLATKRVVVVNPIACGAIVVMLIAALLVWRRRRHRRRPPAVARSRVSS